MIKKILLVLLGVLLIAGLLSACGLTDGGDSANDDSESHGNIIMNSGDGENKSETGSVDDTDDPLPVVTDQNERTTGNREGIFGNAPYTDGAVIDYYMAEATEGKIYSFTQMYGLHVENNKIVAIEDIISVDLVNAETLSSEEKEASLDDMHNQMEAAGYSKLNGQELVEGFNLKGDESVISFTYYVYEPELDGLSSYSSYLKYFEEKGYIHVNGDSGNDDDEPVVEVEENGGTYSPETYYGTPKYVDDASVKYYQKAQEQGIYLHKVILGMHVRNHELLAVESIIEVQLINPDDYTYEQRESIFTEKVDELIGNGHDRAKEQEVIDSFCSYDADQATHFISYVFEPEKAGFNDYADFVGFLLENDFEELPIK